MNDLQRKSFELLQIFLNICNKWDIPYYLVCGSALGAVKYEGFIPWDDDIDVGLLRPDYQRFLEIAPKELPDWCFLQNYKTEENFAHIYTKLRNSNTTFIEKGVASFQMNHGIYIDIFPIDGHPKNAAEDPFFDLKQRLNLSIRNTVYKNHPNKKVRFRNKILRLFGIHKTVYKAQEYIEKLYSKYPPEESELWCNYGNWQGKLEYAPKWHYGEGTWATFEGLRVRIPENYDAYLTQKYGDWRSDPPMNKQKTHHDSTIIDVNISYKHYMAEENRALNNDSNAD